MERGDIDVWIVLPFANSVYCNINLLPTDLALVRYKLRYNTFERFQKLGGCHKIDLTLLNIHWTLRRRCEEGVQGVSNRC